MRLGYHILPHQISSTNEICHFPSMSHVVPRTTVKATPPLMGYACQSFWTNPRNWTHLALLSNDMRPYISSQSCASIHFQSHIKPAARLSSTLLVECAREIHMYKQFPSHPNPSNIVCCVCMLGAFIIMVYRYFNCTYYFSILYINLLELIN